VGTSVAGLIKRLLHDLKTQTLNLNVHLASGDAIGSTGNLKVHISQVVLVAKNVA
jgi:hypothetical protein